MNAESAPRGALRSAWAGNDEAQSSRDASFAWVSHELGEAVLRGAVDRALVGLHGRTLDRRVPWSRLVIELQALASYVTESDAVLAHMAASASELREVA